MGGMYKYILFDWDGTLAKTLDVWILAYRTIAKDLGIDLTSYTDNQIVQLFFGKEADGYKKLGFSNVNQIYEEIKKFIDKNVVDVEIYRNVKSTLTKLKERGYKLALHTSSNRNLLYPAITNNDLEKYFDLILTRDDVEKPKPDPEVLIKEIEYFKANKDECLVVGDSNSDVKASLAAGVDCALYYPRDNEKFYSKDEVKSFNTNFVIHDLSEILDIISKHDN